VTRLEYQAYSSLAIKTMSTIAHNAIKAASRSEHHPPPQTQAESQRNDVQAIIKCAVHHRLGTVPIGESSIGMSSTKVPHMLIPTCLSLQVIAVSSPHRKEAFVACEEILEEVKRKAQIWKREYYEGEDESQAEWKANA
jgi:molybdopterin synthase catalytic subunit